MSRTRVQLFSYDGKPLADMTVNAETTYHSGPITVANGGPFGHGAVFVVVSAGTDESSLDKRVSALEHRMSSHTHQVETITGEENPY